MIAGRIWTIIIGSVVRIINGLVVIVVGVIGSTILIIPVMMVWGDLCGRVHIAGIIIITSLLVPTLCSRGNTLVT